MENAKKSSDDKHCKRICACWDSVISDGAIKSPFQKCGFAYQFYNPDDGNLKVFRQVPALTCAHC